MNKKKENCINGTQMTPELLFESKTHFTDNDLSIKQ